MTLRLDGSRLVLTDDDTNRELASASAATTDHVIILGAAGEHDDTLTVELSSQFTPARGIDYDGGAGGWDTLVVRGETSRTAHRVTQLSPHDGILDYGALQIRYAGLEPVTDSLSAASLTINGTGGGEQINIVDGPPGFTQVNSGASGTFETYDFANKTNVTVTGGGGADIYTLNNPNPATGLATLTLSGSADAETFRVTPSATIPYTIVGGNPLPPGTGDTLIVELDGVTSPVYSLASDPTGLQGSFTFGNRASVTFSQVETINPSDMFLTKTGPATTDADFNATYTVTILNNGANDAANVTMTDAVPAGMTFVSVTAPAGTSCSTPAVGGSGMVSCTTPVLLSSASVTYTLVFKLSPGTPAGTIITNTASVTTGTSETSPGDNSASFPTTSTVASDLSVTKTGPSTAPPSTNGTYTVVVTNSGPSAMNNIALSDPTPPGTTFVSVTAPAGFSCSTPAVGGTGNVSCTAPTLNPGSATFTIVLAFGPTAPATIFNAVSVTTTSPDLTPANNSATTNTSIAAANADVAITKTGPPSATNGTNITYTIAVTNNGPGSATNVTITDPLPPGSTFVSATPTQGTCTGTTTVTCNAGTLASAASMTVTLVVTAPSIGASASNTASVSAAELDPVLANNTATAIVTLTAPGAIPTMSEWALLLLAMSLGVLAVMKLK